MKQIILGTAGHIDHGKTSLIRALTGIDTDRLKEEKERGITIELGFAHIVLPDGQHLGIVDVPGHEKFVKNMVAGATGIDLVAMVIAADEGIMPQTREHMEICELLRIRHGLVVVTKTDLVDQELTELVTEEIKDFVQGTFLEDKPMIFASAQTGEGIKELEATLSGICKEVPQRDVSGPFRLPADRVFTMRGFGTVITGTLVSGSIRVGDPVMLYPKEIPSRVRGIQVHNHAVEEAVSGQRTAINFQGLEKTAVERGDVVARPGSLIPGYMVDVSFHYLKSNKKPLKNRTRVRFHTGTSEIMGVLVLLGAEELAPGNTGVAQVRLDQPVALVKDDRFVVRSHSPVRAIGGGTVLNPAPGKHRRFKEEIIEGLKSLTEESPEEVVSYHVGIQKYKGVDFTALKVMTNLDDRELEKVLETLLSRNRLLCYDRDNRMYIHADTFTRLKDEVKQFLGAYHRANPLQAGMQREELKSKFPKVIGPKLFHLLLEKMAKEKTIATENKLVRMFDHTVEVGADLGKIKKDILQIYQENQLTPPYFRDVVKNLDIPEKDGRDILNLLMEEDKLVKVKDELFYHKQGIDALQEKLISYLKENKEIDAPGFKEMTGLSRKYLIPLMEYFDAKQVTIRVGDVRRLRSRHA